MCGPLLFKHLKEFKSRAWSDREGLSTVFHCQCCVLLGIHTASKVDLTHVIKMTCVSVGRIANILLLKNIKAHTYVHDLKKHLYKTVVSPNSLHLYSNLSCTVDLQLLKTKIDTTSSLSESRGG